MPGKDRAFRKKVKKALAHFDDFVYLRTCPLAHALLPDVSLLGADRGKALQRLLSKAMEHLKPPGAPSEEDKKWRPYHALHYRYIKGLDLQQVRDRLAISGATFRREQERAIAAMCSFLKEWEGGLRPPIVSLSPIPRIENFVGRQKDLAFYRRQFESENLTLITGLAGVGKTCLGAELASEWQEKGHVIWFRFYQGRNTHIEAILEGLALSLAALGQDEYWRFLQADRQRPSPPSSDIRIRYLVNALSGENYTLCFDNFEAAGDDAVVHSLFRDLHRNARSGKLRLLVMSRVTPAFASGRPSRPLDGLCREDARQLLAASGLGPLPEATFAQLYAKTDGLPVFLKLFASWIHSQGLLNVSDEWARGQVQTYVDHLVRQHDVRYYLLQQVYDALDSIEQRFLEIVSAFRLPFDEREEPVLRLLAAVGIADVGCTLDGLLGRRLFTIDGTGSLCLHPLIREYCYSRLAARPADKIGVHGRLAAYYEQSVGDILEAGYHYFEAGKYERAARLLSENMSRLINASQAEAALEQLERLAQPLVRAAGVELRFEVTAARETLCHLLGRREEQEVVLEALLTLAEKLDDDPSAGHSGEPVEPSRRGRRLALAYNRRARFHYVTGEFAAAIAAAEAGQAAARRAGDQAAEAESLNCWGMTLWRCGDNRAARERHEQALALAQKVGDRRGEANSLHSLGNLCFHMGDLAAAQDLYEQVLTIRRATGDRPGEARALNNLGNIHSRLGDHAAARRFREQALVIFQATGDQRFEAAILHNMGDGYDTLGDYATAQEYREQALVIFQATGDRYNEALALNNLGTDCHQMGNYITAREYHEQALAIRRSLGDGQGAGYALTGLGKALEDMGDLDGAEAAYHEALTIRREIDQVALSIDDIAGLARVALAREREKKARRYTEECLAHIAAHGITGIEYPFKVYLTCLRVLEARGDAYAERARSVLEEAYTLLMGQAERVGDEALRRSFLENVPAHRELLRKMQ